MLETVNNFLPLEGKVESRDEREKDYFSCHKLCALKFSLTFNFQFMPPSLLTNGILSTFIFFLCFGD